MILRNWRNIPILIIIFEFANRIIKNRIHCGHKSPDIEILYGGKTYEMNILKNNRSTSVDHFLIIF